MRQDSLLPCTLYIGTKKQQENTPRHISREPWNYILQFQSTGHRQRDQQTSDVSVRKLSQVSKKKVTEDWNTHKRAF